MKLLPHKTLHFQCAGQLAGLFGLKIIVFWHVTPWGLAASYELFGRPIPGAVILKITATGTKNTPK